MSKKLNSSILILAVLFGSQAFADGFYKFKGGEGCTLKKYQNKAWSDASPDDLSSSAFPIQLSRANPNSAVFAVKGVTYGTKKDCLEETSAPAGASSAGSSGGFFKGKRIFSELKVSESIVNGTNASAQTAGTFSTQSYSASIGFAGKFGYGVDFWAPADHVFFEIGYFSGSQAGSVTGSTITYLESDKLYDFHLGYQHYFLLSGSSFTPFASLAIGLSSESGTRTLSTFTASYSGIGFTGYLEAGTLYELSKKWSLTGSLNYNLASITPTVGTTNSASLAGAVGAAIVNPVGLSRIGINIGGRYTF